MDACYISFFKNLLSSDGRRFKCLQERFYVPNPESLAEAAERASRYFEKLHGLPDWRLHADSIEVESAGADGLAGSHMTRSGQGASQINDVIAVRPLSARSPLRS